MSANERRSIEVCNENTNNLKPNEAEGRGKEGGKEKGKQDNTERRGEGRRKGKRMIRR